MATFMRQVHDLKSGQAASSATPNGRHGVTVRYSAGSAGDGGFTVSDGGGRHLGTFHHYDDKDRGYAAQNAYSTAQQHLAGGSVFNDRRRTAQDQAAGGPNGPLGKKKREPSAAEMQRGADRIGDMLGKSLGWR